MRKMRLEVLLLLRLYLCIAMLAMSARAQLSPGPLSSAHRDLEGVTKCSSCHDFGLGARGFKCLDCHTEIKRGLESHTGYHTHIAQSASRQTDCARCHTEHNGAKFPLVRFDRKAFDHRAETGFELVGKHKLQACERCHTAKNVSPAMRAAIKVKDANRTFLGLRRACTACHAEPHAGRLGAQCLNCHSQDAWKPAAGFNHASTKFPLTGLHQQVGCIKCHVPKAAGKPGVYSGVAFAGCQSCHQDPHRGGFQEAKFRGSCATCHNTAGWKKNQPSRNFPHDLTKFPLRQAHAVVACAKCHADSDFHRPVKHDRCQDCHQDRHGGQFAKRASGSDCGDCHNQTKFTPALFDKEAHASSKFALRGKHLSVSCSKCHLPAGVKTVYVTGKLQCADCHEDRHKGAFAAAPHDGRCDSCHSVDDFRNVQFDRARHAATRFPLAGKHTAVECAGCHNAASPSPYRFASIACQGCHQDPHETKLACDGCHSIEGWKPARAFDHAATKFPLEGGHFKVSCGQCHQSPKAPVFARTPSQCAGCHVDKHHGGQFSADCSTCHIPVAWKELTFDHDRARFPLDRAHRNVACARCHKTQTTATGVTFATYRGTALECTKCH